MNQVSRILCSNYSSNLIAVIHTFLKIMSSVNILQFLTIEINCFASDKLSFFFINFETLN